MKQDFMTAARKIGRYLGVVALSFSLLACGGEVDAASNNSTSTPSTQTAQEKALPFPNFPATLEEAVYQGQKGCIADNEDTDLVLGAIARNEGLSVVGALGLIETTKDGAHSFQMMYNQAKDYAYILANKAEGRLCIAEKLTDLSFQKAGSFQQINYTVTEKYSSAQCDFVPRYGQICGTFNQVSGALIKNGFRIDWQGADASGDVQTLLSGKNKTYQLTTDEQTGATVVTGVGDYEFVFIDVPKKADAQLIAKHP